jgi:hypothetical protein
MRPGDFTLNVAIVGQAGHIGYQALLCAASIRAFHPATEVRVFVCIPDYSENWHSDPRVSDPDLIDAFSRYDCEIIHFENVHFGSDYPHSNKFYSILSLPADEPFLFLDSDCIVLGPMRPETLGFAQPALRPATSVWPVARLNKYTAAEVWRSLYEFFELDPSGYFSAEHGDNAPQCYPYYSAGMMYYARAGLFGRTMLDMARRVWNEKPDIIRDQPLKPWLDQVVLPLALARLGVPRSRKIDRIRKAVLFYQFPFFLMVRYDRAIERFSELSKDSRLVAILNHDRGFHYYLSDEGRRLVENIHSQFLNSPEKGNYPVFKDLMRRRAPMMR